jgi:hypothetical protein
MIRLTWISLLLIGTVATAGAEPLGKLEKPYSLSVGEVVALTIPQILGVTGRTGLNWPVLTVYDKPSETIMVLVYGGEHFSKVDESKDELEKYRKKLTDPVAKMLDGMYGVKLEDKDFTLVYYSNGKEIVRREAGQYVIK